tara:strand:- start:3491 stop:4276 length:786 start_codon:yes stop_codon:yes gene_type:complete
MLNIRKEAIGLGLICVIGLLTIAACVIYDRLPQDAQYHNFSDTQLHWFIPNFFNVISNIPFLGVGLLGTVAFWPSKPSHFSIVQSNLLAYRILFIAAALVGIGSSYYHLQPNNLTLVWDRLPMTLAFMAFYSIIISEYVSPKLGKLLLFPLLFVGLVSVFYWRYTEINGAGDLRLYVVVQFFPLATIPVILLLFKSSHGTVAKYWLLLTCYLTAKLLEYFDAQIHETLIVVSGHSIKHVLPALGLYMLLKSYQQSNSALVN